MTGMLIVTSDKMKTHKDLEVWKKAVQLVTQIYEVTKDFPKEESYGLISQIRRSAVSIPSNIAEGAARNSEKEFIQFLYISLGSLSELETELIISKNLGYLKDKKENTLMKQIDSIRKMLSGLIHSIKKRQNR